jgi:iron complex outermembrane receptor protein
MHHRPHVTRLAVLLACGAAAAQEGPQRVEITGSAIKRIDGESALPVTVITRDDIAKSGATSAAELLEQVSATNGGGYNVALAIGDSATPGFSGVSLRGLGPNSTLILLNGRRLAVYAFQGGGVDLNAIPIGAIERVEVLRDGASALYGTDAIGGVINFVTRRDYRGADLAATVHVPQKKGGRSQNVAATFGFGDLAQHRFNGFVTLTWDNTERLKATERDFSKTSYLPDAPGGPLDKTSGNTIPASIAVPGFGTVNPGVPDCLPPYSFRTSPTGACRFDYAAVIDLIAPQKRTAGLARLTFQATPDVQIFGEANKTRTVSTFRISPTPASSATTFNGDNVLYPEGGRWYPHAVNPATGRSEPGLIWNGGFVPLSGDLSIAWRALDAGPRTDESTADQDRFVVGTQGRLGRWDFDAALLRSSSKVTDRYVEGWLYESKLLNATGTPLDPDYRVGTLDPDINPFGLNDAAGLAALRSALVLGPTRISKSVRESVDGKLSGELGKLPGGPIAVAFGTELRRETFDDNPLPVLNSGDIIGGGGNQLPVHGSRSVKALFAEANLPFVKGLDGLLQVRHDRYSDFGSTTNPKLGLRWQPSPQWLVRASWGTGFRAPTMPEKLTPVAQTNTGGNYNDPYYEATVGPCYDDAGNPTVNFLVAYCNNQFNVNQGGNLALQPEKSKARSLGLVFEPTPGWSFGIDYWHTRIDSQIAIPDPDAILAAFIAPYLDDPNASYDATTAHLSAAGIAALRGGASNAAVLRDPGTGYLDAVVALYANLTNTVTDGFDLSLKGALLKGAYGDLRLNWEATYVRSAKIGGVEVVGTYAQFGPIARLRQQWALNWQHGSVGAFAGYRRQSGYVDAGGARSVSPYQTLNLGLDWRPLRGLKASFQVINATDREPPFSRQDDYFHVGYDPTYADPRGRTFALGLNWSFNP